MRLCLAGVLLCCSSVWAVSPLPTGSSDYDDAGANVFRDEEITFIEVTMGPADLADCMNDPWSDEYKVCSVRVHNSVIDETVDNVGIRPRGNTSRDAIKKSWKLSFNEFAPGRKFHGLEKFNINGEHNDVSIIRSKLAWDILKGVGVPSPRAHHVHLTINDGSLVEGAHIHVEQIDDEFVDAWFGNNDGNLYKCLYQGAKANLKYVPPGTPQTYQNLGGGQTYQEEINEDNPDYTDLADFINFINNTDDATFAAGIVGRFSVDNFLRAMAVDVTVGQWDNYWYGANNYYLYHNQDTSRFEYIPYDYDNTYGVDFFGIDWARRPYDTWGDGGYGGEPAGGDEAASIDPDPALAGEDVTISYDPAGRPLEGAAQVWLHYGFNGWNPVISPDPIMAWNPTDLVWEVTAPVPEGAYQLDLVFHDGEGTWDNNGTLDWHFTVIADKIRTEWNCPPLIDRLLNIPAYEQQYRRYLRQLANGPFAPAHTEAKIDQIKAMLSPYAFTGSFADGNMDWGFTAADFHDSYTLPLDYQDAPGPWDWGLKPYIHIRTTEILLNVPAPTPLPRLFVNELLAINMSINIDETGEYEDWVEIYNDEDTPVDLGGMYLSDHPGNPCKWLIPTGAIVPAKGFLLFWCDNEPADGPLHTTFKLDGAGEGVGIFHNTAAGNVLIDYLAYPSQSVDISFGRYPDGTSYLTEFTAVTPAAANDNSGGPPPEPGPTPAVYVNEWMAGNDTTIEDPDEPGEFPDWIELYNAEPVAVDLGGRYLTDDLADRSKWRIPAGTTIPPRGYLLIWADDDTEQGSRHANFKLRAAGEDIGLFDRTSNYLAPIDTLTFSQQTTDISQGRLGDGTECIQTLRMATPGACNMPILGDFDDDGDVDCDDYAEFQGCFGGPNQLPADTCSPCVDADLDNDGDVDFQDFAEFAVGAPSRSGCLRSEQPDGVGD